MNDSVPLDKSSDGWQPTTVLTATGAGVAYFAILFASSTLLGGASVVWLDPLFGAAAAFAMEITVMLPLALAMNWLVAWCFGTGAGWPTGAIVAGTAALLLVVADFALLMLLGNTVTKEILNHGWSEARFVEQVLMAALPLAYPRP